MTSAQAFPPPTEYAANAGSATQSILSTPNLNTADNIDQLGSVIMSEASTGNYNEKIAVGSTVLNRMRRDDTARVQDVWGGYSHNQTANAQARQLARDLLTGAVMDNTGGATHFYSPRSMSTESAQPGWASTFEPRPIPGVRPNWFRFYRAPGEGPVR